MNAPSGSASNETLRPHRGDNADVVTTLNDGVGQLLYRGRPGFTDATSSTGSSTGRFYRAVQQP